LFLKGNGCRKNITKALECFQKSAEQGNALGRYNLGTILCSFNIFFFFLTNIYLGFMLEFGKAKKGSVDLKKAFEFYLLSAEQGNALAQNRLGTFTFDFLILSFLFFLILFSYQIDHFYQGFMCAQGKGCYVDYHKAFELFQSSAKQGNSEAQFNIGTIYFPFPFLLLPYKFKLVNR
jgi:TPR repeat protein